MNHANAMKRRTGWIYLRYLFPLLILLLIVIAMRIPCLQYTTADTGTNDAISAWELIANSFDQSRRVLFGTEEQTQANIAFSRTVLISLTVCVLLFLIGCAVAIWSVVMALRYARIPKDHSTARIAWITLVPNRVALCLWHLCLLPLPAFPRVLIVIYQSMMRYTVALDVTFAEPLIVAALLVLALAAITALLAPTERACGMDPFPNRKKPSSESDADEATPPSFATASEDPLTRKAKEEQLAQIRRMFNDED